MGQKFIIGIDEVGRGPLAGPVTLCALAVKVSTTDYKKALKIKSANVLMLKIFKDLKGLRNSKKLSEKQREDWYKKIRDWKKEGKIEYKIYSVSAKEIDKIGLSKSIKTALNNSVKKLNLYHKDVYILLDGGLKAHPEYKYQNTIIGGDEKESIISFASITAKVFRDRKMKKIGKMMPEYGFENHKGYGTKDHYKAIKKHGISEIHRKSFLKNLKSK
ncbi:MAG: ribonuclease HII [Candidatus Paceibacterota bacterium]|jgi:ribonuclease HII